MEEMEEFSMPILKAVKKTTYNAIVQKANLNLNKSPVKLNIGRSQSFKKVSNFIPRLKPRKSNFFPSPLKLNLINNLNKNNVELEKQLSGDEIEIISNNSPCSSMSSADLDNSEEGEGGSIKKKNIKKEFNIEAFPKISSKNLLENFESDNLLDCDSFTKEYKNMKTFRRKMMQIKYKAIIPKFKETEEYIPDNFINTFDISVKKYENEDNFQRNIYSSVNFFDNKINIAAKTKSIFDVLSSTSKKKNQEI